jgi:hypothetical protein
MRIGAKARLLSKRIEAVIARVFFTALEEQAVLFAGWPAQFECVPEGPNGAAIIVFITTPTPALTNC